jgi:hypothetical protein
MAMSKAYPQLRYNLQIHPGDALGMTTSCLSCSRFSESEEICRKFAARPPARVIAFGCSEYLDTEEIPF